ncbi:13445_t:CDS:2, partial [Funneliformis geosporum]
NKVLPNICEQPAYGANNIDGAANFDGDVDGDADIYAIVKFDGAADINGVNVDGVTDVDRNSPPNPILHEPVIIYERYNSSFSFGEEKGKSIES